MSSRTLRLAFPLLLIGLLLPANAHAAEIVKDGSFESPDNPDWAEGGVVFLPICDSTCTEDGTGGGTVGPRTGSKWVWFGGNLAAEQQFVAQDVTIPAGAATLSFYLWLGAQSGNGQDVFRVFMDDTEIFEVLESSTEYGSYKLVTLDVSTYAGRGAPVELSFDYLGFGPGATNFSLDDVSLQAGPAGGGSGSVSLRGPKKVTRGKKAQLTASVQPCSAAGQTIDLFRGKKKVRTAVTDAACTAKFKVKIKRTSSFRAVSPAGTSNNLKVRVRKS